MTFLWKNFNNWKLGEIKSTSYWCISGTQVDRLLQPQSEQRASDHTRGEMSGWMPPWGLQWPKQKGQHWLRQQCQAWLRQKSKQRLRRQCQAWLRQKCQPWLHLWLRCSLLPLSKPLHMLLQGRMDRILDLGQKLQDFRLAGFCEHFRTAQELIARGIACFLILVGYFREK